jgi:Type IX secretion system membrane protein PorP/SprF
MYIAPSTHSFFEISTWIRKVKNVAPQLTINARYQFIKEMWLGSGFIMSPKNKPAFTAELGFIIDGMTKIGYAYTFGNAFSQRQLGFGNAHEFNLARTWKRKKIR